jgi:hypothetical protein
VQPPQPDASECNRAVACPPEQGRRAGEILRDSLAGSVKLAERGTARKAAACARLVEKYRGFRIVAFNTAPSVIEHAKPRTTVHPPCPASLIVKRDGANRVAIDALPVLVHHTETRAAIADPSGTRNLEQLGGMGFVAEDVESPLQSDRKIVACGGVACIT